MHFYWDLGHDIVVRQMNAVWESGFFDKLSKELKKEFPDMQGFLMFGLANYNPDKASAIFNYALKTFEKRTTIIPQKEWKIFDLPTKE